MLCAARLESGLFTSCINESFGSQGSPTLPFRQGLAEDIEISIPLFLRYQAQVERLYRRAVEEFERLKKLWPELPNEPISEDDEPLGDTPEPQPDEAVPAPEAAAPVCSAAKRTHSRPGTRRIWPKARSLAARTDPFG